jgi:hypothetical protein
VRTSRSNPRTGVYRWQCKSPECLGKKTWVTQLTGGGQNEN